MKRLILACSLIGAIATAQAYPEHHPMDAQQRTAELKKSLQLSDEQAAKVKAIFESTDQQRKALMDKYKPQLDAFHAEQKALHEQTHKQLSGVLTPKQQEALKQQCDKHGSMHKHMHDEMGPDDHHAGDEDHPAK